MNKTQPAIPHHLQIGPHSFALEVKPALITEEGPCWGCLVSAEMRIELDAAGPDYPTIFADTLLHECLHALDRNVGLGLSHRGLTALASGLLDMLMDNPALLEWIAYAAASKQKEGSHG